MDGGGESEKDSNDGRGGKLEMLGNRLLLCKAERIEEVR